MKLIYSIVTFYLLSIPLIGQDCVQNLDEARRSYFNGEFQSVLQSLNKDCLNNGLSGSEKTDALRLIIQSHLMVNNDSLANIYTKDLYQHDPMYESRSTDIAEFRRLVKSFDVKTRFKIGLSIGVNFPQFKIMQYQSYASKVDEPENYESDAGLSTGLNIEVPVYKAVSIMSGVLYQTFTYFQSEIILDYQEVSVREKLKYFTFPMALKWKIEKWKLKPFVTAGFNFHRLIKSTADISLLTLSQDSPVPYTGIPQLVNGYDISLQRKNWTTNYLFGGGIAKSFGLNEFELAVYYEHGKNNLVEVHNRYADPIPYRTYSYVSDDFKMNHVSIMVSFTHSFVKPKKIER